MQRKIAFTPLIVFFVSLLWLVTLPAGAVDWQSVSSRNVPVFYPGQVSWEWLLTEHKGADQIKAGQFCRQCHEGKQREMGALLINGKRLEAEVTAAIDVAVKTAYDRDNLYIHLEWTPGAAPSKKLMAGFESMASIMLDDGHVPEITRGGCWGACHDDVNGMASAESNKNIDKYLVKSRTKMTRKGGADNIKSAAELESLANAGFFAEIWQAQLNRGQATKVLVGTILETRHDHSPAQVAAKAEFNNGKWLVDFSRKLKLNSPGYKNIEPGKTYTMGIAIHDGYIQGRKHYVSFGYTLKLDNGAADFIARKQ
ncbi:MAG: ethylbenzene dehydrogenase-related protein [Gammaproteobacteria bacterium]